MQATSRIFQNVAYASTQIPTYPGGQIGILIAEKAPEKGGKANGTSDFKKAVRPVPVAVSESCKYYSEQVHEACFTIPKFIADRLKAVNGVNTQNDNEKQAAKRQKL